MALTTVGEYAGDAANDAIQHIRSAVIPLYRESKGNPESEGDPSFVGSGVLLRAGNHHLLLTAAHVLDDAADSPFVALGGRSLSLGSELIEQYGLRVAAPAKTRA